MPIGDTSVLLNLYASVTCLARRRGRCSGDFSLEIPQRQGIFVSEVPPPLHGGVASIAMEQKLGACRDEGVGAGR